jgi:glycosyltransferase involved in cell wall biosynthesis
MGRERLADGRTAIPILYLAPWIDIGGSDTATIDWFRFLPRDRFRASLITTQVSPNRRLAEVVPYAEELWELPQLLDGPEFPRFILSFIHTRGIRLVHIMNSHLGFDLLPDIHGLPNRPRVVVQFHGEEPDQAGYVRYAATRYGNLIDAYSLTTGTLDTSLNEYEVPAGRRRLIRIGVDAEAEFSPELVRPIECLARDRLQILFAGRLTAQKDPLLVLDVASRLRAAGLGFQIHVVGDGDLTGEMARGIRERGLEHEVSMHGGCAAVAPWYRSCDVVLMTSAYETSPPRVAHEAMAMARPVIAPRMAALEELVTPDTGILVDPPRDAGAYATAILGLATDPKRRRSIGEAGRTRVRAEFTVARMAADHGSLYEELLSEPAADPRRSPSPVEGVERQPERPPSSLAATYARRPTPPSPLVSVIVICFNQGHYLAGCLRSVADQTYQPIETIVVDDGSTERETLEALEVLERKATATVIRLGVNRGPSAARNAGLDRARGRYVLPLDSDDLLPASAVSGLVEQLRNAPADVGFVYPSLQFFGNRGDRAQMPSYNLHALLGVNHCPVSSLFDREVFDRGHRYPEEITLGDEDWDFVLTLGEHGIHGQAAASETLLCRKHGFTRCDLVAAHVPFAKIVEQRHPRLFAERSLLKGQWSPSLSILVLDPIDGPDEHTALCQAASSQSCPDFELIAPGAAEPVCSELERRLRPLHADALTSRAQMLARSLELARGRWVLAIYGSPAKLLTDPALVEKLLRTLGAGGRVGAIALARSADVRVSLRLLDAGSARRATLGALCWTATGPSAPPPSFRLPGSGPLEALAAWHNAHQEIQWRGAPGLDADAIHADRDGAAALLGAPRQLRAADRQYHRAAPELPDCPPHVPHRLESVDSWMPPQVRLLYRHLDHRTGRYLYTNGEVPPAGCAVDRLLGCVRALPFRGTAALRAPAEVVAADGDDLVLEDPELLGFVDRTPLPLLDELRLGRHPRTHQVVLVAGDEDPLAGIVTDVRVVGYIQPHPLRPRLPPATGVSHGLAGLVRSVDLRARRHRYASGRVPPGLPAGELGALLTEAIGDCDPLWIDAEGRVFAVPSLPNGRPSVRAAIRWIGDPLTWAGFSHGAPKVRASARRTFDSARILVAAPAASRRPQDPAGYLLRAPSERTVALHAGVHPVTGDQLLTTDRVEIDRMGYRYGALLGYLVARAPVTGRLGAERPAAPWAARFGQVPLNGEVVAGSP